MGQHHPASTDTNSDAEPNPDGLANARCFTCGLPVSHLCLSPALAESHRFTERHALSNSRGEFAHFITTR